MKKRSLQTPIHKKTNRYTIFQLLIRPNITGEIFRTLSPEDIILIFKIIKFIKQSHLIESLLKLKIIDRKRSTHLVNFYGQLEKSSENDLPYWRLNLETKTQTTGKSILKAFQKQIKTDNKDFLSYKLSIQHIPRSISLLKSNNYILPSDCWKGNYFEKDEKIIKFKRKE